MKGCKTDSSAKTEQNNPIVRNRAEVDVAIRDGKLVSIARHFGPTIDDWHIRLLQFYQDHGLDKQEHEITDTKKIEEAWMVGENPINPKQCLDTIGSLLKYLEYKHGHDPRDIFEFLPKYQPTSALCRERNSNKDATWCGCSAGTPSLVVNKEARCDKKEDCEWLPRLKESDYNVTIGFPCKSTHYDEFDYAAVSQPSAVSEEQDISMILKVRKQRTYIGDEKLKVEVQHALLTA